MSVKEDIADHFAGIVTHPISIAEQHQHNLIFRKVRKATNVMLRREAIKICKEYNND